MPVSDLEAKEAIREVIDTFANLECDIAEQAGLFTPDAHVEVFVNGERTMDIHGVEELVEQFSAFTSAVTASHHQNGQQVITLLDQDTASDVHYCQATLLVSGPDGATTIASNYIRYTDTLVRRDGAWRIAHREQHFLISETRPFQG